MRVAPLLAALTCACTGVASANRGAERNRGATSEALRQQLAAADERTKAEDYAGAAGLLDGAIAAPAFEQLPSALRHAAIASAASAHFRIGEIEKAGSLYLRASETKEATADDWFGRSNVARRLHEDAADTAAITVIARRWPEEIRSANAYATLQTTYGDAGSAQARLELLEALFNARWTIFGMQPSQAWRELSLRLIDRDDLDGAALVADRVTSPYQAIAMRVDRRFDRLLDGAPPLDVHRVQDAEIEDLRRQAGEPPLLMRKVHNLLYALGGAGEYGEMLRISGVVQSGTPRGGAGRRVRREPRRAAPRSLAKERRADVSAVVRSRSRSAA